MVCVYAGKRLAFTNNEALSKILQLVEQGIAIVESYCRPGEWMHAMEPRVSLSSSLVCRLGVGSQRESAPELQLQ